MKLFSRRIQLVGPPAQAMAYASEMCTYVSGKLGREVALWNVTFGAPAGSMTYAVRVEGIAEMQSMTSGLLEDPEYHAKLAAGADMVGAPAEDTLATVIHGELGDPPPVGAIAGITQATIANGAYAEAFGWGVDMAQHVEGVTGIPTMFLSSDYGPFGSVAWIGVSMDAEAVDSANAKLMADADYMAKLGAAGELFAEGSGVQALATRIA